MHAKITLIDRARGIMKSWTGAKKDQMTKQHRVKHVNRKQWDCCYPVKPVQTGSHEQTVYCRLRARGAISLSKKEKKYILYRLWIFEHRCSIYWKTNYKEVWMLCPFMDFDQTVLKSYFIGSGYHHLSTHDSGLSFSCLYLYPVVWFPHDAVCMHQCLLNLLLKHSDRAVSELKDKRKLSVWIMLEKREKWDCSLVPSTIIT